MMRRKITRRITGRSMEKKKIQRKRGEHVDKAGMSGRKSRADENESNEGNNVEVLYIETNKKRREGDKTRISRKERRASERIKLVKEIRRQTKGIIY